MPGKRNFEATITTRYGLPEKDIYRQVIDLVKKNNLAKSRAQLLLVERGLQHTHNPGPLVKTVIKEVPVEKIVEKVVYKSPPKVDKSTSHIQEHVSIDEHITDESIGGDQRSGQYPSGETLMTQDRAGSPNKEALEAKNSPGDNPGKGSNVGGWIALGGFLALILGPVVYSWFTK